MDFLILILCQWQPVIRVDQGLSFSQWEHRLDDTRPIRKRETRQLAFFSAGDVSGSSSIGVISQLVQRDENASNFLSLVGESNENITPIGKYRWFIFLSRLWCETWHTFCPNHLSFATLHLKRSDQFISQFYYLAKGLVTGIITSIW